MMSGMKYKQGDVILVPVPFTNLKEAKQRPALIISNDDHNNKVEDVVICGITSNIKDEDFSVILEQKDMEEGKKPGGLEGRLHPIGIFMSEGEVALFELEQLRALRQEYTQWTYIYKDSRRLERIEEWDVVFTDSDVRGRVRTRGRWYEITKESSVARKEKPLFLSSKGSKK